MALTAFLGNDYYLRIVFMMCVYFLCAAGMNVLVGYAGQKSLGQAGLFAAGAYAVALITTQTELNPWLALVLAAGVSGVCGVLIAEKLLNEDRAGPMTALMQSLNMLACTEGKERTLAEYDVLLREAGFAEVQGRKTAAPLDAVIAFKR